MDHHTVKEVLRLSEEYNLIDSSIRSLQNSLQFNGAIKMDIKIYSASSSLGIDIVTFSAGDGMTRDVFNYIIAPLTQKRAELQKQLDKL